MTPTHTGHSVLRRFLPVLAATMLAGCIWFRYRSPAGAALDRLRPGMSREEMVLLFSGAWHHDECPGYIDVYNPDFFWDVFWYDSTDVTRATVVQVRSSFMRETGAWAVDGGNIVDNAEIWQFFHMCSTLDLSSLMPDVPPYK